MLPDIDVLMFVSGGFRHRKLNKLRKAHNLRRLYKISEFSGRLCDRIDLIKPVSSVRPYVRSTYVRPSTKSFFDFNDIWHVGRGR